MKGHAVYAHVTYRPARRTPRPRVQAQTAVSLDAMREMVRSAPKS